MKNKTKKILFPVAFTIFAPILSFVPPLSIVLVPLITIALFNFEEIDKPNLIDHIRYNIFFYILAITSVLLVFYPTGSNAAAPGANTTGEVMGMIMFIMSVLIILEHGITTILFNLYNKYFSKDK